MHYIIMPFLCSDLPDDISVLNCTQSILNKIKYIEKIHRADKKNSFVFDEDAKSLLLVMSYHS